MSEIELSELYDKLVKHYKHISNYVDKEYIIDKTLSYKHKFNPNKGTSEKSFFATIIKSALFREYDKNKKRMEIVNRRNNKIDLILS